MHFNAILMMFNSFSQFYVRTCEMQAILGQLSLMDQAAQYLHVLNSQSQREHSNSATNQSAMGEALIM